jgi:hypothetical protein
VCRSVKPENVIFGILWTNIYLFIILLFASINIFDTCTFVWNHLFEVSKLERTILTNCRIFFFLWKKNITCTYKTHEIVFFCYFHQCICISSVLHRRRWNLHMAFWLLITEMCLPFFSNQYYAYIQCIYCSMSYIFTHKCKRFLLFNLVLEKILNKP